MQTWCKYVPLCRHNPSSYVPEAQIGKLRLVEAQALARVIHLPSLPERGDHEESLCYTTAHTLGWGDSELNAKQAQAPESSESWVSGGSGAQGKCRVL